MTQLTILSHAMIPATEKNGSIGQKSFVQKVCESPYPIFFLRQTNISSSVLPRQARPNPTMPELPPSEGRLPKSLDIARWDLPEVCPGTYANDPRSSQDTLAPAIPNNSLSGLPMELTTEIFTQARTFRGKSIRLAANWGHVPLYYAHLGAFSHCFVTNLGL